MKKLIVVIDGYCNLCSGLAQFLIRIDKHNRLHFVAGQSPEGMALLKQYHLSSLETVIVIDDDRVFAESEAVLHILSVMQMPWRIPTYFKIFPKGFRNLIYRTIARNRLKWFGKRKTCYVPYSDKSFNSF